MGQQLEALKGFWEFPNKDELKVRERTRTNLLQIAELAPTLRTNDFYASATLPQRILGDSNIPRIFKNSLQFSDKSVALVAIKRGRSGFPQSLALSERNRFYPRVTVAFEHFNPKRVIMDQDSASLIVDRNASANGAELYSSLFLADLTDVLRQDLETQYEAWSDSLVEDQQKYFQALNLSTGSDAVSRSIVALCEGIGMTRLGREGFLAVVSGDLDQSLSQTVYNHDNGKPVEQYSVYTMPYLNMDDFIPMHRSASGNLIQVVDQVGLASTGLDWGAGPGRYSFSYGFKPTLADNPSFEIALKSLICEQSVADKCFSLQTAGRYWGDSASMLLARDFDRFLKGENVHNFGLGTATSSNVLIWSQAKIYHELGVMLTPD